MNPCELVEEYHVGLRPDLEDHVRSCADCTAQLDRIAEYETALGATGADDPRDARISIRRIERRATRKTFFKEVIPMAIAASVLAAIIAWQIQSPEPPKTGDPKPVKNDDSEQLLVTIDSGVVLNRDTMRIGPGGRIVVVRCGGKDLVYEPGKPRVEYDYVDEIGEEYLVVLNRTKEDDDDRSVIFRGVEGPKFTSIAGVATIDGGSKIAYIGVRGETCHLVVDGKEGPALANPISRLYCIPGTSTLAWTSHEGKMLRLVVAGKAGPPCDSIEDLAFSADGKRHAFVTRSGRTARVIVDGVESEKYEGVTDLAFSADGKTVAYLALKWGRMFAVVNGVKGAEYDDLVYRLEIGPDGSVAYLTRKGQKYLAHHGNWVSPEYDEIHRMWINPAGKVVLAAGTKDKTRIICGAEESEAFARIDGWIPSSTGGGAFSAWNGGSYFMVVNGRKGEIFDEVRDGVFSPDGTKFAYCGLEKHEIRTPRAADGSTDLSTTWTTRVVVQERPSEAFDQVLGAPRFTKDGTKVIYTARKGLEVWRKVVEVK